MANSKEEEKKEKKEKGEKRGGGKVSDLINAVD